MTKRPPLTFAFISTVSSVAVFTDACVAAVCVFTLGVFYTVVGSFTFVDV